jgi:Kef-type K+ transport system membrane component KefB
MASIIVVLIIGIIIGTQIKPTDKVKSTISRFQFIGVTLLLFSMGAGLGLNDELLKNLKDIGWTGLVFAVLTTVFSIAIVYLVTTIFERSRK